MNALEMLWKLVGKCRRLTLAKLRWHWIYYAPLLSGAICTTINKITYGKAFDIGKGAMIWGSYRVLIIGPGTINVGQRFHCVSKARRSMITLFSPVTLTVLQEGKIRIGDHVGLNGTVITATKGIYIGDETMIAPNTIIVDSDFHAPWPPEKRWSDQVEGAEVRIGKRVWIGMNVTVLKGVTIGDNAIIAAGSIVSTNIEANCLAAGNPAKKIRSYVPEEALEYPKV